MSHTPDSEWWGSYFDEVFLRVYRPLLDTERTALEIESIRELLGVPAGSRILDVGCGWGRHSLELARQGFDVTGVDQSETLLREAEKQARSEELEIRWVPADMRELAFNEEFDACLSLFSSLGYFLRDDDDLRVLEGMRNAAKPGGLLILDTMHRDLLAREYVERDWWETPTGDLIWVERSFDAVAGVSHEVLRWRDASGATGEKPHTVRVRSASEWADLLHRAGWRPLEWLGGWNLEPFTHESGRLVIVAEKAGGA